MSAALVLWLGPGAVGAQPGGATQRPAGETLSALQPYPVVYRLGGTCRLGIDRFISDSGDSTLLYCDYETGFVRPLFRVSPTEWNGRNLGVTFWRPALRLAGPHRNIVELRAFGTYLITDRSAAISHVHE